MDKWQTINDFWNGFDIPAYDENSVPDDVVMPYISYSAQVGSLDDVLLLVASVWDRSTSWRFVSNKVDQIARYVGEHGHIVLSVDNGLLWVTQGDPFAQRMNDPSDDSVRRIYITLNAEFLTNY